jgi:hypothetical protein
VGRSRSHKSDENLRGVIRELKKQVRDLQRQLRQYNRFDSLLAEALDNVEEERIKESQEEVEDTVKCPKCKKGHISVIDLGRIYHVCNSCSYRKKV